MILKKIFLFIALPFLFFACQQEENEHYQSVLKSELGDFRGVEIGSEIEVVQKIENDSFLLDKMDDYLYYEYDINMGNSYTVSYDFSPQNKLYEIELTTYLDEVKDAQKLVVNFTAYFNDKYGESIIADDGFITWKDNQSKNIEFAMIDNSESYGVVVIKISDLDN